MATPIRIKRSAIPGKKPQVADLKLGELALNTYDAELYTLRDRFSATGIATEVVRLGAGATVTNILYVTKDGNDNNTGKKLGDAKATIKSAVGIASTIPGTVIKISAGTYLEDNPISLPSQISVVGDLLDIASNETASGKTPGRDLKEGIPTLVTLFVMADNDPADKELILKLNKPISDQDLPNVILELRKHKALKKVQDYLSQVATEANDLLIDLPAGAAKDALNNLTFALVNRST